jgi:hypothetical protein
MADYWLTLQSTCKDWAGIKATDGHVASHANVWNLEEAQGSLERLLSAAESVGPQEIVDGGRRFLVTVLPLGKRQSAKGVLAKGGPLPKAAKNEGCGANCSTQVFVTRRRMQP